ncbi:hypothetical protein BDW68DRAFT_180597 [Aspergillus falconensis]
MDPEEAPRTHIIWARDGLVSESDEKQFPRSNAEAKSVKFLMTFTPQVGAGFQAYPKLAQAGLFEAFKAVARYDAREVTLCDKLGNVHMHFNHPGDFNNRPEIARPALRHILLDFIRPEHICWGHGLETIVAREGEVVCLLFQYAHVAEVDFLIGADRAKSVVRRHLDFVTPEYAGITMVETSIPSVNTTQPRIAKLVGKGSLYVLDENGGLWRKC